MPARSLLPAVWDVPQIFRDRLGEQVGRQRAMQAENHLLIVLHRPPKPEENQREGVFFWRSPQGEWKSTQHGGGPAALQKHLDAYAQWISKYDQQEQASSTAAEYFHLLESLAPLLRATRNMHATLQQARTMCPQDRDIINARDRAYELERTAELLYGDAKNELDYMIARKGEEQAETSRRMAAAAHRLNVLAAFFFPIATLTAVFGMGLRHGWEELYAPWPFVVVLTTGLVLGALLTVIVTRPAS